MMPTEAELLRGIADSNPSRKDFTIGNLPRQIERLQPILSALADWCHVKDGRTVTVHVLEAEARNLLQGMGFEMKPDGNWLLENRDE